MKSAGPLLFCLLLSTPICWAVAADLAAQGQETPPPTNTAIPTSAARALIPVGRTVVTTMEMGSPRLRELMERFQAAVKADPNWMIEYVKTYGRQGEPLPYHPKMGVSEDEYKEIIGLAHELQLTPGAEAELTVRAENSARFVLDGGTKLPDLTGIVIDLAKDHVETPFGTTAASLEVKPSTEQSLVGPWTGFSWTMKTPDFLAKDDDKEVTFYLGRLQSGKGFLYYNVRRKVGDSGFSQPVVILTYDLPPPGAPSQ